MNKRKTRTTYGVYNLIEWYALLRMGKATVKVPFIGGSITTQGVTPATYTTEDPVIQLAIERSPEYRNGKIKVVRRVQLDGEIEIERNVSKYVPATTEQDGTCRKSGTGSDNKAQAIKDEGTVESKSESDVCVKEQMEESSGELIQMEFSCNDDAKDYLEQTHGFVRSKLHNREDIISAARSKGVEIIFV